MIRYFQLTPDILLEYVYNGDPKIYNKDEKDIYDSSPTKLVKSNATSSRYFCFISDNDKNLNNLSNLVLPLNNIETQFVVAKSKYQNFYSQYNVSNIYSTNEGGHNIYEEDTEYDTAITNNIVGNKSCDIKSDKCIIHFTSRNYFGDYDAFVFQTYVYMKDKSKLYLASFLFKKTTNSDLSVEHMLYNGNLYTTQIEFDIPSVYSIFIENNEIFNNALLRSDNSTYGLMENTPISFNIFGVKNITTGTDNYDRLNTYKINSIAIPYIYNISNEPSVIIKEAEDGDYYNIKIEMNNISIINYFKSMGEDIRKYMIMHELCLEESWVDNNETHSEITHKEFHIIDINEDDEDEDISKRFDVIIKYRPICINGGNNYIATIIDTVKIINSVDNTSYKVSGSEIIENPNKYGKKISKLPLKETSRPMVNVYNKKVSDNDARNIIISNQIGSNSSGSNSSGSNLIGSNLSGSNRGSGFVIKNLSQNITSFIECTNIGVRKVEISPDDIN